MYLAANTTEHMRTLQINYKLVLMYTKFIKNKILYKQTKWPSGIAVKILEGTLYPLYFRIIRRDISVFSDDSLLV